MLDCNNKRVQLEDVQLRLILRSLMACAFLFLFSSPLTFAQSQHKANIPPTTKEWVPLRDGIGDSFEPISEGRNGVKRFIIPQSTREKIRPDTLRFNEPVGQQMLNQGIKSARFPIPIVNGNKGFYFTNLRDFASYIKKAYKPRKFKPRLLVLHNTSIPSLAQRPNGFSEQNMQALRAYYGQVQGWHAGPAAFVDQHGVWVFTGFQTPGRHSPSWNYSSWGIEQLGEYSVESYDAGPGAVVQDHAVDALAILAVAAGLSADTLKFHKEDPETTHKDCPGKNCQKKKVQAEVKERMQVWQRIWASL